MSSYIIPLGAREGGNESGPARIPASMLGAIAGVGLLLLLPGQANADRGYSYGHAEISLGFPNGQVTVGRTWEDEPRAVVVEQVTHKFPETDLDEDDAEEFDEDEAEPDQIIIEKRHRRPRARQVTIIERYEEPVHCDRVEVVRKVYVERPSYHHHDVVVYRAPQRVIYAPSRAVIYAPGGRGHSHNGGHRQSGGGSHHGGGRGYQVQDRGHGPRDLFPESQGRPTRERGVRKQLVQVGVNR